MEYLEFIAKLVRSNTTAETDRYWRVIVKCFLVDGLEEVRLESLPYYYKQFYGVQSTFNGKLPALVQEPEFKPICIILTKQSGDWVRPSEFLLRVLCAQLNSADLKELKTNSLNNVNTLNNNDYVIDHNSSNQNLVNPAPKEVQRVDQNDESRFGRLTLEELNCAICFEIIKEAVEGDCCKNIFCQQCIEHNGRKCPNCRKIVRWTANEPIRRLIAKKPIQCDYDGCGAWSTVSEIEQHKIKCEFRRNGSLVGCQKCQQRIPRKSLAHFCTMNTSPCRYCGTKFARKDLDYHEAQQCDLRLVPCARGCNAPDMTFKEYHTSHVNSCPFEPVSCTYEHCSVRVQRRLLTEHTKSCQFATKSCPNKGCTANIKLDDKTHETECPFKLTLCKYGCKEEVLSKDVPQHLQSCPKRTIQCEWCAALISFSALDVHKSSWCPKRSVCKICKALVSVNHALGQCPKRLMPCPYCKNLVTADMHNQHMSTQCLQRKVPCNICQKSFTASVLTEHEKNCVPEVPFECPDCQVLITERSYVSHRLDLCPMRKLECQFCHTYIAAFSLADHQANDCPERRAGENRDDMLLEDQSLLLPHYRLHHRLETRQRRSSQLYRQCVSCQKNVLGSRYELHAATCTNQKEGCAIS